MGIEFEGGSRFFRLFGSGKDTDAGRDVTPTAVPGAASANAAHAILMQDISDFLLGNGLAVTANNLLAAHAAFSGEDAALARKIVDRRSAGLPITQEWLDQNRAADGLQESVKKIVGALETSLETFTQTTRSAHAAAENYNSQIAQQVSAVPDSADPTAMVAALEGIAQEMIARGNEFAAEMKRSEAETESLRKELEKARHDADVDHLTGLPNRRAFEGLLDRHFREARQEAENLCVAFCDIDHFKRVNDTHGHDTGDRVIRAIGEALARITNDNCHVARQGGEEFVMLFRGKTPQEAWDKLDAVRENFGARNFVNRSTEEPIGQITFSGGIADVFAYANPRDALKAADEALYRAKEEGRNRIMLAG
ncbi:GGDEF domain-containing protein [Novosphingobium sp. ERN07]|uniref:GGDEF domain-containing protein n=1 Tax=Novosphingobium sp. ERN07 TaxID=2726187 RepID=UPI00351B792D